MNKLEHKTLATKPHDLTYSYYLSPDFNEKLDPSIPTLVRYTWSQLDQLALTYEQAYKKIYLDPRFELTRHGTRPIDCIY